MCVVLKLGFLIIVIQFSHAKLFVEINFDTIASSSGNAIVIFYHSSDVRHVQHISALESAVQVLCKRYDNILIYHFISFSLDFVHFLFVYVF